MNIVCYIYQFGTTTTSLSISVLGYDTAMTFITTPFSYIEYMVQVTSTCYTISVRYMTLYFYIPSPYFLLP